MITTMLFFLVFYSFVSFKSVYDLYITVGENSIWADV